MELTKRRLAFIFSGILVVACIAIAGCIEEKSEFTLNPDGSGKVVFETTIQPIGYRRALDGMVNPQVELYMRIEALLTESAGVDAWKDVSYKLTKDECIYFKGTAYFPDISKLNIYGRYLGSHIIRQTEKNEKGEMVINVESRKSDSSGEKESTSVELSEAKLNKQIQEAKVSHNQFKWMYSDLRSDMKLESILHLPGTIKEVSNFQKINNRTVRLEVSGDKINKVEDEVMNDEDFLRKKIREGKDITDYIGDDLEMNEKFFGEKAPIRIILASDSKNQFDYDSEVNIARKNYRKMISKLGLEAVIAVRDTEVLVPKVSNAIKHENLFEFDYELCSLPMSVRLPRKAISVGGGIIEKAIASSGKNVLGGLFSSTGIYSLGLKEDGQLCEYEVSIIVPDDQEKSLKEVSGNLYYFTAEKCREIDLGMMDFKTGSNSKESGFSISEVNVPERNELVLKLNLPKGAIRSFEFYNEYGAALDVLISTKITSYDPLPLSNFYFSVHGKFPPRGRIVLDVWDGVKKYKVGFKAIDIPLVYDEPDICSD